MASTRRRGVSEERHANHERWLITYADLITLLLAFFVVMYSMSKADLAKFQQLQVAIQRAFNVGVLEGMDPTALGAEGSAVGTESELQHQALEGSGSGAVIESLQQLQRRIEAIVPSDDRGGIQVGLRNDGIVISLYGTILFDSGQAKLREDARLVLTEVGRYLQRWPYPVRVEGHTDDIPPVDTPYPTNWELSTARALAVVHFLVDQVGLPAERLSAAGYAEHRPLVSNETREGRVRNRRVDIVILHVPQVGDESQALMEP